MKIIVDTREQLPFLFTDYKCATEKGTLGVGDYSLVGFEDRVSVERKSVDDLVQCLCHDRERFERELARARALERFVILVECDYQTLALGKYRSQMRPSAVLQSLAAFQVRYGASIWLGGSRKGAEYYCYSFLSKYADEMRKRWERCEKAMAA